MTLLLSRAPDGQERHATLSVPTYLAESAQAAADILESVSDRQNPPQIQVKLLNVLYEDGQLRFPELTADTGVAYPLLVIQPSYIINVTSLTHFDYCGREHLMDRFSIPVSNQPMHRGALVHSIFDFMLREERSRDGLIERCHVEMDQQLPALTLQDLSPREHYADVRPHLNALFQGFERALDPATLKEVYVERYMISPALGLKGKIDALVRKRNGHWQALELKTGKSWGHEANRGHRFQVLAYHLLLHQAGISPLDPPAVVYTGNNAQRLCEGMPPLPSQAMVKTSSFDAATAVEIINLRNALVRIDYTGQVDFDTNPHKCSACLRRDKAHLCVGLHCMGLHGGQECPEPLLELVRQLKYPRENQEQFLGQTRALLQELQAIRVEHGRNLQSSIEERISQGVCLPVKSAEPDPQTRDLALEFPDGNSSEFREGDACLLSDSKGPVDGNCVEVYIKTIDKTSAVVALPRGLRGLWFDPAYLDVNAADSVFERNFAAVYALWAPEGRREDTLGPIRRFLLGDAGAILPNQRQTSTLESVSPEPLPAQRWAVELAMGLRELLLIHGPPGTGKTYTLALIVKALAREGRSLAVATYTHRAADEVMSKLISLAPMLEIRRLARPESVAGQHKERCLDSVLARAELVASHDRDQMLADLESRQEHLRNLLRRPAVYVGTTQAWLTGKHDALPHMMGTQRETLFDVMVVDEATQIITPNLVGVLRLAKSWILAGDHKQLPPIVVGDSRDVLEQTLFEQIAENPARDESLLVQLDVQHRMPVGLSTFIGSTFYGGNLRTSPECAQRRASRCLAHPLMTTDHCIALVDLGECTEQALFKQYPEEAQWVTRTMAELHAQGWPLRNGKGKPTIGIIAPYRAQVALVRRYLEKEFDGVAEPALWNEVVDTVDRFQGDEREIIMLSLCLRPGGDRIPRIYEDERRINVALSRAMIKLWVVGSISEMRRIPVMRALRQYVSNHPEVCLIESDRAFA
ncbi:MAG: AAA family ATPase [Candidatus Eisenbacteria bacterium]|nr:AAA family ATPase [Candidatus Eisenbacteria bacterium]